MSKKARSAALKTYLEKGFPSRYIVLDIETTGFSPQKDTIIEIGAIRIVNNAIQAQFHTLINPGKPIPFIIKELTGLTDQILQDGLTLKQALYQLINFIDFDPIVAHNAEFESRHLIHQCQTQININLENIFIDTFELARRVYPDFQSHKLENLVETLNIPGKMQHRALPDAIQTASLFEILKNHTACQPPSQPTIQPDPNKKKTSRKTPPNFIKKSAKDICPDCETFHENSLFFGATCVFTGQLQTINREDAMQIVANLGGFPADAITRKTNFLIIGEMEHENIASDGKTQKQRKAEEYIAKSIPIQIISESEFIEMLQYSTNEEKTHE